MEDRTKTRIRSKRLTVETPYNGREGFDVTQVIGHVAFDAMGTDTPHEAAFRLIAGQDTPGGYSFPMADGGTCHVEVMYSYPDNQGNGDNVA